MSKNQFIPQFAYGLILALSLATTCFAQDAPAKEKNAAKATKDGKPQKAKAKTGEQAGKKATSQDRLLKSTSAMVLRKFAKVNLTEAQTAKANEIIKGLMPELAAAQQQLKELITPERKKAMAAARTKAKADGLKKKELQAAIDKAANISENDRMAHEMAKTKIKGIQTKIAAAVTELLSEEQKGKLSAGKPAAEKTAKNKGENKNKTPKKKKAEKATKVKVE